MHKSYRWFPVAAIPRAYDTSVDLANVAWPAPANYPVARGFAPTFARDAAVYQYEGPDYLYRK